MQNIATELLDRLEATDIVNLEEWIFDDSNRGYMFHDHGFIIGFVFAHTLQDALDILADSGRIDHLVVDESERGEYSDDEGISFLGNYCKPFDAESVEVIEFPPVPITANLAIAAFTQ